MCIHELGPMPAIFQEILYVKIYHNKMIKKVYNSNDVYYISLLRGKS